MCSNTADSTSSELTTLGAHQSSAPACVVLHPWPESLLAFHGNLEAETSRAPQCKQCIH